MWNTGWKVTEQQQGKPRKTEVSISYFCASNIHSFILQEQCLPGTFGKQILVSKIPFWTVNPIYLFDAAFSVTVSRCSTWLLYQACSLKKIVVWVAILRWGSWFHLCPWIHLMICSPNEWNCYFCWFLFLCKKINDENEILLWTVDNSKSQLFFFSNLCWKIISNLFLSYDLPSLRNYEAHFFL